MNGSAAVMDSVGSGIKGVEEGRVGRTTAREGMQGRGWTGGRAGDGEGEEVEGIDEGFVGCVEGEGEECDDVGHLDDFQDSKACSPRKKLRKVAEDTVLSEILDELRLLHPNQLPNRVP